jgi:hypothetical protein
LENIDKFSIQMKRQAAAERSTQALEEEGEG